MDSYMPIPAYMDLRQFINLIALEIAELYTAYPTNQDICPVEDILLKYIASKNNRHIYKVHNISVKQNNK